MIELKSYQSYGQSLGLSGRGAVRTMDLGDTHHLKLTVRQQQVLLLLVRGMSNKEIARALKIAEGTARIHTAALLRVLRVRNRTEAAFKAANLIDR